ncbi:MAG: 50S ribosomal protein L23 [Candidatus Yanofskybacteria bacterium]|nr:50S ribosomal protein L23 [Candidatus Yanofskybacteria bacterium]
MAIFSKTKKKEEKTETPKEFGEVGAEKTGEANSRYTDMSKFLNFEHGVLKGFYVSEKASRLVSFNQYVFKVFKDTTKNEIKKQVEKNFSVKVKRIKVVNLPRKNRTVGRNKGFKQGVKKAIVVLKEGYTIDSVKA